MGPILILLLDIIFLASAWGSTEKKNSMQSAKLAKLEEQLTKEAAFLMTCATRNSVPPERNTTITFDYITADFNNADNMGGADGQFDISTGIFTYLTGGIYEVTFSG